MHTVGLIVYPDFQSLGLAVTTVFEYANLNSEEQAYALTIVSEDGGPVRTSEGFTVNTERLGNRSFDTLIVTGDNHCRLPSPTLIEFLRRAPERSRRIASVCTGAFVLAAAGLLDGKRATRIGRTHAPLKTAIRM